MTTVERFQIVAAVAAAIGVVCALVPGLRGASVPARQAGGIAMTVGAWILLVGSLVSRNDLDRLADRLGSPARVGAAVVAVVLGMAVTLLAVRLCVRRPVVWLVMAAIAMPIRVPVSLGGDRSGNLLLPLYWVVAVGLIGWVWAYTRGRERWSVGPSTPLDLPIAAFVGFSLVSTWWSGDIQEATVKAVFFYIPFVLLYRLILAWWPAADRPLRAVTITTVSLAAAIALVAVGQFATKTIWWNENLQQGNVYNRFFRANGLFYDPNILGRYLMLALLALAAYAWVAKSRRALVALGIGGAIIAAGLVVTFSRSSALGLMVGVTLLAIRAFGWRRTVLVGGAALVLLGGPAIAFNENVRDKATSVERLASTGEGRFRLAKGGVELWKEKPVTGVGLGAFASEYAATLSERTRRRGAVVISHTAPVTVLAELGLVGLGLFAVLCLTALVALWRAARRDPGGGWPQWTALTILIAIFVHSLLYSGFFEDPFIWALAGLGLAVGATQPVPSDATRALPVVDAAPAG